jgi:hypothetical protein
MPGTELDPSTSKCVQCPINCYICTTTQICQLCNNGYYITGQSNIVCAPNCIYPCLSCSITNASMCLTCVGGYTFNPTFSNHCQPITNCSSSCNLCPGGFVLTSTLQCLACNSSCVSCTTTSPNSCTSCPQAQYVLNGQCVACSTGCMNCTSISYCLTCSLGYLQNNYGPGYSGALPMPSCPPCQYPCLGCSIVTNFCTSCVSGYILMGAQCLNGNFYIANITFTAPNNTFMMNYGALVTLIANTVASNSPFNLADLFPAGYARSNNTINFTLYISSQCFPQTVCSQNELKALTNLITNSTQLAGMQVTAASLAVSFNNNSTSNSTFNCSLPCQSCNQISGACTTCISGFTVINGACLNQSCTVLNCNRCGSGNICTACNPSFILTSNTCICRIGFSVMNGTCMCNPTTSNLQSTAVSNSSTDVTCILCRVQNCLDCNLSTTCTLCAAPYSLNQNGLCVICNL